MMEFLYDKSGSITGFTYADKTYFYVKNPQGDVTNIVDSNGVNLVNYYYYCYGESTSYVDESSYEYGYDRDSAGIPQEVNPITYRGYYRDEETSFYYLQSRYYIPTWGRFVNADVPIYAQAQKDDFAGINLFAYCRNNPVNFSDPTGFRHVGYVSEAGEVVAQAISAIYLLCEALVTDLKIDAKNANDNFAALVAAMLIMDPGILKPEKTKNKKKLAKKNSLVKKWLAKQAKDFKELAKSSFYKIATFLKEDFFFLYEEAVAKNKEYIQNIEIDDYITINFGFGNPDGFMATIGSILDGDYKLYENEKGSFGASLSSNSLGLYIEKVIAKTDIFVGSIVCKIETEINNDINIPPAAVAASVCTILLYILTLLSTGVPIPAPVVP